eukprot:5571317-Pleurochrysis_carterae.AAC.1
MAGAKCLPTLVGEKQPSRLACGVKGTETERAAEASNQPVISWSVERSQDPYGDMATVFILRLSEPIAPMIGSVLRVAIS